MVGLTMPPELTAQLIRQAQGGDREAFGELVREFGPRLLNLAHQLMGNRDTAAEVVQESLVRGWVNLRQLKTEAVFYSWLVRIVVNQTRNRYRRDRNQTANCIEFDGDFNLDEAHISWPAGRHSDERTSPHQRLEYQELKATVDRAVEQLPLSYRAPLVMFTQDDMSHAEIAVALDIPEETARWRVHQARKLLRERLKGFIE